jgi:hypothetical protein
VHQSRQLGVMRGRNIMQILSMMCICLHIHTCIPVLSMQHTMHSSHMCMLMLSSAAPPTLLLPHHHPRRTIMDDPFIRQYVEDLLRKIRTQVGGTAGCPCPRIHLIIRLCCPGGFCICYCCSQSAAAQRGRVLGFAGLIVHVQGSLAPLHPSKCED